MSDHGNLVPSRMATELPVPVVSPEKRKATISIDLDDAWAYRRAMGDRRWEETPSILPTATPRLLRLCQLAGASTVFVCGRDIPRGGQEAVEAFLRQGTVEIGDHSFAHDGSLPTRSPAAIVADLAASQLAITAVTGKPPQGFRCPSFGSSPELRAALRTVGYWYDASLLPTWIGPLLRAWHRVSTRSKAPRFAPMHNAFRSQQPSLGEDGVLDIPVTCMPFTRLPIHGSYLVALGPKRAERYLRFALDLCERSDLAPSFLIHPPDVLDKSEAPMLAYLPGMETPWAEKYSTISYAVTEIRRRWPTTCLRDIVAVHAQ